MAAAAWGVRVGVAVVLVPDGRHVARVSFEEQLWHRIEPFGRLAADRANLIDRRLLDRQLGFDHGAAFPALKVVAGHQSSSSLQAAQTPQMAKWSTCGSNR